MQGNTRKNKEKHKKTIKNFTTYKYITEMVRHNKGTLSMNQEFVSLLKQKSTFMLKVFGNLLLQLFVIFVVCNWGQKQEFVKKGNHFIWLVILSLALIIIMAFVPMPIYVKWILMVLFSMTIGLELSYRTVLTTNKDNIAKAIIMTGIVFIAMVLFGFFLVYSGVKIPPGVGTALLIILIVCIIAIFSMMFFKTAPKYFVYLSGFLVFLFSLFIVYDTYSILQKNYAGDFVSASLSYLLDLVNLFEDFLNIFDFSS